MEKVYVADPGNDAVDIFTTGGTFLSSINGEPTAAGAFSQSNACSTAVDAATEHVYVADSGPDLVYVFDEHGALLSTLNGGTTPSGSFGSGYVHVAVDPTTHDLYVADSGDAVIDKFDAKGEYVAQITGAATPEGTFGEAWSLAVSATGEVDVIDRGAEVVDRFSPSGEYLSQIAGSATPAGPFEQLSAVAVGATGHILVADSVRRAVYEFDASGVFVTAISGARTPAGMFNEPEGVAESSVGDVFVADRGPSSVVDVFGPVVTVPDATTEAASNITAHGATLSGTVNPDEAGAVSCRFDFGTSSTYGGAVSCPATIPSGGAPVGVNAPLAGLQPDTTYHYRIEATNANGTNDGEDVTFTTKGPGIGSEWATDVTATSATLHAQLDPNKASTTYYFEYGPTTAYGARAPGPPGLTLGPGAAAQAVSVHLQGLTAGSVVHYRLVAVQGTEVFSGTDHTLRTSREVPGATELPDGRAWEMVSPVNKEGAALEGITDTGGLIEAAEDGTAIAYLADAPVGGSAAGNPSPEYSQIISTRNAAGWQTRDIATPHETAAGFSEGDLSEYKYFAPDISRGIVEPKGELALAPSATEKTPYIREGLRSSAIEAYEPLVTGAYPPGSPFGGEVTFVGASTDSSYVLLRSRVALTPTPITSGALYEWHAGGVQLVSLLHDGTPAASPTLGDADHNVRGAVSPDGNRITWTAGEGLATHLYLRDMSASETVQLDVAEAGVEEGEGEPHFQITSEDASKVLFTDTRKLTHNATARPGSPDLYEYETTSERGTPLAGTVSDLTVDSHAGQSADVQGVVPGMGESGADVYFVATGVLSTGENAEHETPAVGADNLYVRSAASAAPTFIAQLSSGDAKDWEGLDADLGEVASRVSPNGGYLAFMSERALTGYDNRDAHSGVSDEEVYLYDVAQQRLSCVSCAPSGARPSGVLDPLESPWPLYDRRGVWRGRWLAASIPGWTSIDLSHALYQSRYLSDEGRLFFNSSDSLVARDTNHAVDVYEFEPAHVGSCETSNAGFVESDGGCLALISSGSSGEAAFLDASTSGEDVFFLTDARLTRQDRDTAFDVYDAHRCTSASPCISEAASTQEACSSADSCRPAPVASPSPFGPPPTAAFLGVGNVPTPAPAAPSRHSETPRQKLAKALRNCAKRPRRARARCAALARRQYVRERARARRARSSHPPALPTPSTGRRHQ